MTVDLFDSLGNTEPWQEPLAPDAVILRKFALSQEAKLMADLQQIIAKAPFRYMTTPGSFRMTVAMTNCGRYGWISDRTGYKYDAIDPISKHHWPVMPEPFLKLATDAAAQAGFEGFLPDACLINLYEPGARLSLHQDKDEQDFSQPIVSVSLGIPAVFLFGGLLRADKTKRVNLTHGDVVVWGGSSRLRFHGVLPVQENTHPTLGRCRINLTFRVFKRYT